MSDGTLRLIGLSWALLENSSVLLLEEPEMSLHFEVTRSLIWLLNAGLIGKKGRKQIFSSTHSPTFLWDEAIEAEEILLLTPPEHSDGGTKVWPAADIQDIEVLREIGERIGFTAIQTTTPKNNLHIAAEFEN
ncbi:MAG: AAA family ATPase [Gammaproteobacteria bacterium AqS3]|nr:AAA family ATPase [Gammaproteobacteria bacterium AqS3]